MESPSKHPIRALRKERGQTLEQLADVLGTTKGNLSRIENGQGMSDDLKRKVLAWSGGAITADKLLQASAAEAPG